jgi:hypothetical protein
MGSKAYAVMTHQKAIEGFVYHARGGCEICSASLRQMSIAVDLEMMTDDTEMDFCHEGGRFIKALGMRTA